MVEGWRVDFRGEHLLKSCKKSYLCADLAEGELQWQV